jgi:hypothetical protein
MPEFLGLDKKKWLWIGVAVAGVAGLYLLTHQGSATPSAGDAGLPQTGPPTLGNMTPGGFFDQGEQVAAFKSSQDRFQQMRQAQAASDIHPTGIMQGIWKQLDNGTWQSTKNPGNVITEEYARAVGPDNHGPYAKGGGGFLEKAAKWIGNNVQQAAQLYAASQGVPLPTSGQAYNPPRPAYSPFTPPIAPGPSPNLRYGNNPQHYPGEISDIGG